MTRFIVRALPQACSRHSLAKSSPPLMRSCMHATATLHATDTAISVRCASKEARSCNFCSKWFSVCMPRLRSMQQMRQYQVCKQTTLAQKRYAAAIFVMLDHLFACHGYIPCDRYDNVSCKCRYDNVSCKFGGG